MDWIEQDNQLCKEFTLQSFSAIVSLLPQLAAMANEMDHHPDFEVFSYSKIKFKLQTHSEGKVTEKDFKLAAEIDILFS
jgi:4a-hydroxytetrahydrobiopterin dehydratase